MIHLDKRGESEIQADNMYAEPTAMTVMTHPTKNSIHDPEAFSPIRAAILAQPW